MTLDSEGSEEDFVLNMKNPTGYGRCLDFLSGSYTLQDDTTLNH